MIFKRNAKYIDLQNFSYSLDDYMATLLNNVNEEIRAHNVKLLQGQLFCKYDIWYSANVNWAVTSFIFYVSPWIHSINRPKCVYWQDVKGHLKIVGWSEWTLNFHNMWRVDIHKWFKNFLSFYVYQSDGYWNLFEACYTYTSST